MGTLPNKELLRRGEVLGGTGWTKGLFKKFEDGKLIKAYKPNRRSRKLYYRCQVVKLKEQLEKGEIS